MADTFFLVIYFLRDFQENAFLCLDFRPWDLHVSTVGTADICFVGVGPGC